ncbi:MAG: beta-lactamase family protein [Phycisphaerae bacterium]|nr:beta-lactamase family protein [Phycisphaerae bacterium]
MMNIKKLIIIFCLLSVIVGCKPVSSETKLSVNKKIEDCIDVIRQKYNLPAVAGAIITSDGLWGVGVVGVRKKDTDIKVTVNDLWHLGSETKAMTASLAGVIVQEGLIDWDTTISEMFPELSGMMPETHRNITLKQFLAHRTGLTSNLDWAAISRSGTIAQQRQEVLKQFCSQKLDFQPDTNTQYSNMGYVLASIMLEKATNSSWEKLIAKHIFRPLKMKSAGFGGTGTVGEIDQPWPHFANGRPTPTNGLNRDNPLVMAPAGCVHCSIEDWGKFVADHLKGSRGNKALLQKETYQILHHKFSDSRFALGWVVYQRDWAKGNVLTHRGTNNMNFAETWLSPNQNFAVLVCINQGGDNIKEVSDQACAALIELYLKNIK